MVLRRVSNIPIFAVFVQNPGFLLKKKIVSNPFSNVSTFFDAFLFCYVSLLLFFWTGGHRPEVVPEDGQTV